MKKMTNVEDVPCPFCSDENIEVYHCTAPCSRGGQDMAQTIVCSFIFIFILILVFKG